MFRVFLSEEKGEDVVVEVVCRKEPIEGAIPQVLYLVGKFCVGITVNDRHLIPLEVPIQPIISVIRVAAISDIQNAGILHLISTRRLKIYVGRQGLQETMELKA
jgi:hypothetical protein